MNAALAMIEAAAPKDEIEAALAVQMAACHVAAMAVLAKMDVAFATERRVAAFGSAAARLMRAYATQVEVLRRLRSGGQQYVRVEHVHVNDGGPGCHRQCEKVGYSHFQLMRSAAAALAWGHHNCNRRPGGESLAPLQLYGAATQGEAPAPRGTQRTRARGPGPVDPVGPSLQAGTKAYLGLEVLFRCALSQSCDRLFFSSG
jgi:hypothetical protein